MDTTKSSFVRYSSANIMAKVNDVRGKQSRFERKAYNAFARFFHPCIYGSTSATILVFAAATLSQRMLNFIMSKVMKAI